MQTETAIGELDATVTRETNIAMADPAAIAAFGAWSGQAAKGRTQDAFIPKSLISVRMQLATACVSRQRSSGAWRLCWRRNGQRRGTQRHARPMPRPTSANWRAARETSPTGDDAVRLLRPTVQQVQSPGSRDGLRLVGWKASTTLSNNDPLQDGRCSTGRFTLKIKSTSNDRTLNRDSRTLLEAFPGRKDLVDLGILIGLAQIDHASRSLRTICPAGRLAAVSSRSRNTRPSTGLARIIRYAA